jgi:hypothetical protein
MPTVTTEAEETAQLWRSWAVAARQQARAAVSQGDQFDSSLKTARATIYDQAVALLQRNTDVSMAAALMMKNAGQLHVRTPPLIGFDQAAVRYTIARTWQRCALMLDPSLDEVQPRWPEG